jgi:hypothetical protein
LESLYINTGSKDPDPKPDPDIGSKHTYDDSFSRDIPKTSTFYFDCRVNKFIGWIQENIQKFSLAGEELF